MKNKVYETPVDSDMELVARISIAAINVREARHFPQCQVIKRRS